MLTEQELHIAKAALPQWDFNESSITRHLEFSDFKMAFAFMTEVALTAESMHHHPRWFNNYNIVDLELTTHDENGISAKDVELANAINELIDG